MAVIGVAGSSDHDLPKNSHNIVQQCEASAHCSFAGPPRASAVVSDDEAGVVRWAAIDLGPARIVHPEYRPPKLTTQD
ncbi:MAG: hypothetical protein FJ311_00790 [Rhodospirillales bacterium]|nr:hypothetical protein [Rhodospirillales bacterium]